MSSLPSDREYILQQVLKRMEDRRPPTKAEVVGPKVQDFEHQDYRNTDPSAGTGEGSPSEPQKLEII